MPVQGRLCDSGFGDDTIDADRGDAVTLEELIGRAQDPLTGLGRRLIG